MKPKITNNINSFKIPSSILFTGKLLQAINTDLATKFAAKIYGTPLKFKIPERELMMRNSAKNEILKIESINKDVMVYRYGFSKKKVLIVHGWAGRGTQLYQLSDKILENKMMVFLLMALLMAYQQVKQPSLQILLKPLKKSTKNTVRLKQQLAILLEQCPY